MWLPLLVCVGVAEVHTTAGSHPQGAWGPAPRNQGLASACLCLPAAPQAQLMDEPLAARGFPERGSR